MRVALCGPYPFGEDEWAQADGLTHCVVTLARAIAGLPDTEVHVVSRSRKNRRQVVEERDGAVVCWVPDPAVVADHFAGRYLLRRALMRRLSEIRPDIVHAQGEAPFIRAALDSSIPHVVTLHGIFAMQAAANGPAAPLAFRVAYAFMRRWEREYLPRIENLIAINDDIAGHVRLTNPRCKIDRVDNPIDARFFGVRRAESAHPVVLFVGQLSRLKGVHVLLDAFQRVAERHESAELRVVGGERQDPPYAAEMRARAASVGAGRVSFLGPLSHAQVAQELSRAWVYCLPSLYEASPLALTEALAAGTPSIATDVGDTATLLRPGGGMLVSPGDAAGIAAALDRLLGDKASREEMSRSGRAAVAARAQPDAIAMRTWDVYHRILTTAAR